MKIISLMVFAMFYVSSLFACCDGSRKKSSEEEPQITLKEKQEITLETALREISLSEEKKQNIRNVFKSHQALALPAIKQHIFDYWDYGKLRLYKKITLKMMCQQWLSCPVQEAFKFSRTHNNNNLHITYMQGGWFGTGTKSFDLADPQFETEYTPSYGGSYTWPTKIGPESYYGEQVLSSPDNFFHVKIRKEFWSRNNKEGSMFDFNMRQIGSGLLTIRIYINPRFAFISVFGIPEPLQKEIDAHLPKGNLVLREQMAHLFNQLPDDIQQGILKQFKNYTLYSE